MRRTIDPVESEVVARSATIRDTEGSEVDHLVAQDAVDLVVEQLSQDEAEVLIFRVVANLDAARTAELMGRSESWVRMTQHRALHRLGDRLGPDPGVPD